MVTAADRRVKYDAVRMSFHDAVAEQANVDLESFASGEFAAEAFGTAASSLDGVCLVAMYEKNLPLALWLQVEQALRDVYTWSDIASAIGVSRQAAKKRRFV